MTANYFYLDKSFFKYEQTISVLLPVAANEAYGPLNTTITSLCDNAQQPFNFATSNCSCWPQLEPESVPLPNQEWEDVTKSVLEKLLSLHRLPPTLSPTKICVEMISYALTLWCLVQI